MINKRLTLDTYNMRVIATICSILLVFIWKTKWKKIHLKVQNVDKVNPISGDVLEMNVRESAGGPYVLHAMLCIWYRRPLWFQSYYHFLRSHRKKIPYIRHLHDRDKSVELKPNSLLHPQEAQTILDRMDAFHHFHLLIKTSRANVFLSLKHCEW